MSKSFVIPAKMDSGRKDIDCNFTPVVPSYSYLAEKAKLARTKHTTAVFSNGLTNTIVRPANLTEYLADASTETDNTNYNFGGINTFTEVDSKEKLEHMEKSLSNIIPGPFNVHASGSLELDDQTDSLGLDGFNGLESIFPNFNNDFRRPDGTKSAPQLSKPKFRKPLPKLILLSSKKPAFDVSCINQSKNDEDGKNDNKDSISSTVSLPSISSKLVNNEPTSSNRASMLTSSWEEGPRRSAFLPYKYLTNLQRGNKASNETQPSSEEEEKEEEKGDEKVEEKGDEEVGEKGDEEVGEKGDEEVVEKGEEEEVVLEEERSIYEKAGRGDLTVEDIHSMKDINEPDSTGLTALMWSAAYGQTSTVKLLINEKADIHLKGEDDGTALHHAAAGGHHNAISVLLAYGARVNAVDKCGNTPLHYAVSGDHPHATTVLLESGADLFQLNNKGLKVYDLAINPKREDTRVVIDNFLKVAINNENTRGLLEKFK